ncbi:MAG TPA: Rieske (2Fe-2S) protein [Dehalococcoidia bacterium]|nr:Rieske (2Fe-2S) protein [Dehalococcoidia bacterium]
MPGTAVWLLRAEARFRVALSLVLLCGVLALGLLAIIFVASFAWPSQNVGSPELRDYAGKISDYRVNEPVFFGEGNYWLVRQPDDTVLALSARDSGRGCTLPWRENFSLTDPATGMDRKGWFRSPCGGDTYDLDGTCVFGPCSRNLDRYRVEVSGRSIIVHYGDRNLIRATQRGKPRPLLP